MADLVVTVPSGTLTLPADVIVPAARIPDLPAGAVSSVNGETGAVVLDAADVGAAPALGADDNYVTDAEKAALHTHPAVVGQGATQADARTALGLGTAAVAATGDFATAAQGGLADSAVQPGDLGNAASLDVGTTAGTVAAGDDSRITGALPAANLDTAATALDANPASALRVQQDARLSSTYARAGSLRRWRQALGTDPATAKVVLLGDSTTANATDLFTVLQTYYTQDGMALAGVPSANIINGGHNGASLQAWLADANGANTLDYTGNDLIADAPDLVVASYGLNDVRLGLTTRAQMVARLRELVAWIAVAVPGADVVLRVPNSLTTTVVGTDFVDGITHQDATDLLRAAYLSLGGEWPHVVIADTQADVFGTTALPTSALMYDELHPSVAGYRAIAHYLAGVIGNASHNTLGPLASYRFRASGYVVAAGNGYLDLQTLPGRSDLPLAREWPLTTSDVMVIAGYGPWSMSGATFGTTGTNMRILKTGDWTALAGAVAQVAGAHPAAGMTEGRYFGGTIDLPSIAAGASYDQTVTISGITREMAVLTQPPSGILATGLLWCSSISADNTVTVRLHNPTGSPIDLASDTGWRFWIAR